MSDLSQIPRDDLIAMLKEAAWYTGCNDKFPKQGYSFDVDEETAYRDVLYRHEPIYDTPEEAIVGHWRRHFPQ
jgi:hypothetical protein